MTPMTMSDREIRPYRRARLLCVLALGLAPILSTLSCGDSSTGPSGGTVASVEVTAQGSTTILVGGTVQLQATPRDTRNEPVTGPTITWSSQDEGIARVDAYGLVTGVGAGTTQIVASAGGKTGQVTVTVVASLAIETTSLPDGTVSETYSARLEASGGYGQTTWSIVDGSLPPGLELDGATGTISGTPAFAGDYTFTVHAGSNDMEATQELTIRVVPGPLAFVNRYLYPGFLGESHEYPVLVSGGTGEYEFSITDGALPAGLALGEDGVIRGVPTEPGTGFFEVMVRSGEASASRVYALTVSTNPRSGFNIAFTYEGDDVPPAGIVRALDQAAARIERVITSDFGEFVFPDRPPTARPCHSVGSDLPFRAGEAAEDLVIVLLIQPLDGPGEALGRAGMCGYLDENHPGRTFTGELLADRDDLPYLVHLPDLTLAGVVHEILHVLGFNEAVWHRLGLVEGNGFVSDPMDPDVIDFTPCGEDPRYVGANAVAAYRALGGEEDSIPLQTGDPHPSGQWCDTHWDEATFGNELMSGVLNLTADRWPLSAVTLGALEDLWYSVDYDAADPFVLPGADAAPAHAGDELAPFDPGVDHVRHGPAPRVRPDGGGSSSSRAGGTADGTVEAFIPRDR